MTYTQIQEGSFRKLWSGDVKLLQNLLLNLEDESRYMRFGHQVSDNWIKNYAGKAIDKNCLVWGYFNDAGDLLGVAEMRRYKQEDGSCAEVAFAVSKDAQKQGIGRELMRRIIRSAQNRSIKHLYMNCLADNEPMQRLAKTFAADLSFEMGEVVCDLKPAPATAGTMLKEAIDDGAQFVQGAVQVSQAIFNRQRKKAA